MKKNYSKSRFIFLLNPIVLKKQCRKSNENAIVLLLFFLCNFSVYSQCNLETPTPFIEINNTNLTATGTTSGLCVLCAASNPNRLTDSDTSNFATASVPLGVAGSVNFRVTDNDTDYTSGSYVGYRIAPTGVLNIGILNAITIRTYWNGALAETASGSSLLGLNLLNSSGSYVVGFNTTHDFDAIEISIGSLVGLLNTINVYYPVVRNYCIGPDLTCNTFSAINLPTYPVSIEPSHTGVSGVGLGNVSDVNNSISSDNNDYATINLTLGVASSGSIAIKDQITDYPAGFYAGFEIENTNLVSLSALGNIAVTTFLNGVQQEQFSGNNLLVNAPILSVTGRFKIGFITTQSFDEVRLSMNQVVGLDLGTTRVYSAVFEKFCAGPALPCNTLTGLTSPVYPMFIDGAKTGINGAVCALCTVSNADNLIDANTSNYAQIDLTASVGSIGSIAVKDALTDYPLGTFAGFDIENNALLNVNALNAIVVTTYLNGTQQETKTGTGALVAVGTDLLIGGGRKTIGFVTTLPFDEVRISLNNTALVSLGITKIYAAIFEKFCATPVVCNQTYAWTNPNFPVAIDSSNSGITGVACVACAVSNVNNVLTSDITDSANISITAGVAASGTIAVRDYMYSYPSGTFAGFTIKDLNNLIEVDLFNSITISTYNNGVLQQSKGGGQLIGLTLLIPVLGTNSGVYNVGFYTTLPFNEIKITVNALAAVINNVNVYGAFVDTHHSNGGSLICLNSIDAVNDTNTAPIDGTVGGDSGINVYANDTLNGAAVVPTAVVLTSTPNGPLTVNSNGTVTVAPNTPSGTYTVNYTICEAANLTNCDTATVTVVIGLNIIDAVNDITTTAVNGTVGGNSGINVYANDTLNGVAVVPSAVILTSTPNGPLTVNADGTVTVAPNTPAGTYFVNYTICEALNSSNCDTATVTVVVKLTDFTPTIDIDDVVFLEGATKDFVVNISEIGGTPSIGQVTFKIIKQSAFTITYGATTSTANVLGGVPVNNSDWVISENPLFLTVTLKSSIVIGANSYSAAGLSITRKPNVPTQTWQPITVTIVNGTGSDSVPTNNTYGTVVKAQ